MRGSLKVLMAAATMTILAGAVDARADVAAEKLNARAMSGEALTGNEIRAIYANRTWNWGKAGGGYFAVKKQEFTGFATGKGYTSQGAGVWFVIQDGTMCFRAQWLTGKRTASKVDCFEHRKAGGTIYQRKVGGDWYVFRGAVLGQWDEIRNLKSGNRIARLTGSQQTN